MKNIIIIIVVAALIGAMLLFSGLIPGLSLGVDNETVNKTIGNLKGYEELIGPKERKGFIISHLDNGFSQTISVIGKIKHTGSGDIFTKTSMQKYKYLVYGRKLLGDWELLSKPDQTSKYISNENPDNIAPTTGEVSGGIWYAQEYAFEFVGNDYKAMRIEFWGYIDENANWWDIGGEGYKWRLIQRDEADLYEGWGSLSFESGPDGRPKNTYAIGETIKINVKTHYGGDVGENGKPWKVVFRSPADRGGTALLEKYYADNVETYFTYKVTEDMYSKTSNNEYKIEIYNTLIEKGETVVRTIDIAGNAPSEVTYSGPIQSKTGESISVELEAEISSETQLPIDYFRVSIYVGSKDTLFPSDPFSDRWILRTTDLEPTKSGSKYTYTLTFTPDSSISDEYITIWAVAYDTEGRGSLVSKKYTIWIYQDTEVPEETIEGETGQSDDWGGHTEGWREPWDPAGGNWEDLDVDWLGLLISFFIVLGFIFIAYVTPLGKTPQMKAALIILGIIIAVVQYAYFFTDII